MPVICELCGKEFKNTQGLRGHMTFVHSQYGLSKTRPATERKPAKLQELLGHLTEQDIERRLSKIEHIVGISEPSLIERFLDITRLPIPQQVAKLSEQLNKLSVLTAQVNSSSMLTSELKAGLGRLADQVSILAKSVSRLQQEVRGHESWLNPDKEDAVAYSLDGGPIKGIEKRLDGLMAKLRGKKD